MRVITAIFMTLALGSGSLAATTGDSDELTTIVVTGLRASLEKSLEIKKNAPVIVDSINATELGRFPDDDVADSLSHITGISISRTTGGEGLYVGVRGLGSSYNIVTLNNRILATDDDGRDLAFDVLPSDVISGADVLKSPQASAIEGSIGGTVNLRSARPFDDPGFHSAIRLERTYNDMSYFGGTKGSAFVSNTFADNTMGFLVGAVLSDQKTRTDALNYNTYDPDSPGVWPLNSSTPVVGPCCISWGSIVDEKKREALSGTFEWRPSGDFRLAIDGLATWLHDPQVAYNESYFPDFAMAAPGTPAIPGNGYAGCPTSSVNGCPEWTNVVVKNGYVTSFTGNNFDPEMVNDTIDRVVDTVLIGANAAWTASSALSFKADVYLSRANRPEGGNDSFVTAGLVSPTQYNQNIINWTNTNGGLPNISVTLPDGEDFGQALAAGKLNNNFWNTHYVGLSGFTIHDEVKGATLDGTLKIDKGNLDHFDFGVAETLRDKSRWDLSNDWTNGSSQYNFYTTPYCQPSNPNLQPIPCGPELTFGSMGANVISTAHFPNWMQGSGGSFPTTIAVFNAQTLLAALKKLDGQQVLGAPPGTVFDFSQTLPQFNAVNSYNVSEHTTAVYGELTFSGTNWSGNAGLRLVRTATTSSTGQDNIESVTVIGTSVPTAPANVVYSNPTPISSSSSYIIPMPAANFAMWLDPKLQLRLAAAETITRPELNQLAPTRTDNTLNQVYELTYSGNSSLKPIRSYQADISLEWYYQPKSALTLAIFGKKLKDFITTGTVYNVNIGALGYFAVDPPPVGVPPKVGVPVLYTVFEPINGDHGTDSGIEISEQHFWDNGFGVRGEYTHNWSKSWVQGQFVGQLEGVSPSTASLGLIYEKGPISSSISWDYSSSFVAETFTEVPNVTAISDSFNWVTASFSYQITRDLKLYVSGKNLTNSIARSFLAGRSDLIWSSGAAGTSSSVGQGYSAYGRTVTAGVSLRF